EKKNALDAGFLDALEQALINSSGVRAWLVRSTGDVFSAGYDLTALNGFPEGSPLPDERLGAVFDRLTHHPAPSVALVTGLAVGLCHGLARNATRAVRGMKRGFELLRGASGEALAQYEVLRRESFNSADVREGKEALLARRAPVFRGE